MWSASETKVCKTKKKTLTNLEHCEQGLPEGVKVAAGWILCVEPTTKELHAKQSKDDDKQKQQQQQAGNGTHTVQ